MKLYSRSYANVNRPRKGAHNFVNGWKPEHTLAHVGQWQGRRARYRGIRKNLFDLRRCAVVHNLHVLARSQQFSAELQETA